DPSAAPRTLKVDPISGKTLKSWATPGSGLYGRVTTPSGGHGVKWVDGKYWMAVPASGKLFLMEPESGEIVRSIPAPGVRTHGLAWDRGFLWCVESDGRVIYKLDPADGTPVARIELTKQDPEPHGLDIRDGVLWYCDAASGWICRLSREGGKAECLPAFPPCALVHQRESIDEAVVRRSRVALDVCAGARAARAAECGGVDVWTRALEC